MRVEARMTDGEVITQIDRLLNDYTIGKIAPLLNQQGLRSGAGLLFTATIVARLYRAHNSKSATIGYVKSANSHE